MQAIQLYLGRILSRTLSPLPVGNLAQTEYTTQCNWDVNETSPALVGSPPARSQSQRPIRISYLTEQTSHHPPVSAYFIECPQKGISARGFDQISANFTGTRIRVSPGAHNLGIFVTLHNFGDETYNLTHPIAHLGGLLRGEQDLRLGFCEAMTLISTA